MILLHGVAQLQVFRAADVQEFRAHPDHEQLSDFFLAGHLAQSLFGPLLAVAIQMDRPRLLKFIFSESEGRESDNQRQDSSKHVQP